MKKILLLVAAISLSSCSTLYKSYPISDIPKDNDKTTIYYNIPQTEVVFEVKVNKTICQKGIFANQSNLLGLKNVITSDEVKYSVKDIKITSREVEDPDQQYALLLNDNKVKVTKSEIGTLTQIFKQDGKYGKVIDLSNRMLRVDGLEHRHNEHFNNSTTTQPQQLFQTKQIFESRLQEKGMLEKTNLTAEEVVKKIEQLREKQIDILSGSVDGTYMNTTVDFMYKQLDEIIDGYVSLFTGTESTVEEIYYYTLNPKKPIMSEEDLILKLTDSPMPLLARFHTRDVAKEIMMSGSENAKRKSVKAISDSPKVITLKEKSEGINGVYYSIPERVEVSVETPYKTYRKALELVQYGAIKTFNSKNYDIEFDSKTGAIKSISNI